MKHLVPLLCLLLLALAPAATALDSTTYATVEGDCTVDFINYDGIASTPEVPEAAVLRDPPSTDCSDKDCPYCYPIPCPSDCDDSRQANPIDKLKHDLRLVFAPQIVQRL